MIEAGRPRFAVVIPAHNEAAVLGRCLSGWINDLAPGEAEVVVVANGCTDTTAQVARDLGARVVELDTASKSAALTAGDHAVTAFPRIYLDADIRVTAEGLRGLVAALEGPEPRVGAPAVRFVTGGASRTVRAFYRMYERLPYARKGLVGLGLYGLSESGRARFGDFPELTADDLFVQRLFSPQERVTVSATFDVLVPRDLSSLIKIRRRTATGNRELESADLPAGVTADVSSTARATLTALVRQVRAEPGRALDALVYLGVVLAARMGSRLFGKRRWERDESTRGGAASREHLVDEATPRGATVLAIS